MVLLDIVFIDTSVFLAENFLAPCIRINAIGKLGNGCKGIDVSLKEKIQRKYGRV